jgi:hypothetical protein
VTDETDRYLDEMFDRLAGTGGAGRRALVEAEDHLRAALIIQMNLLGHVSGELRRDLGCDPLHRLPEMLSGNGQPHGAGGEPRLGESPEFVGDAAWAGCSAAEQAPRWRCRHGDAGRGEERGRGKGQAIRSARRRAASLWPPTHTGGPPGVMGGTPRCAARSVVNGPSNSAGRRVHRALAAARWSSVRAPRSWAGTPTASNSSGFQPVPTPRIRRPPETTSRVAAWLASTSAG